MEAMQTYRLKGASGSVANQVFDLRQRTVIGRADDCDLRLADEACAPHHCEIERGGDGALVLKQIDNAPGFATRVNGRTVECTELLRGDEIRIGACRWVVQAPGLRPQRVLTGEAVVQRRSRLPWLLATAALAAAALAWQRGWIPL
jgi:predicted component of type VI protein secretion system